MTPYADAAELAAYMDPDSESPAVPPLATVLLRSAQQLVLDATAGAIYDTDANEHATDAAKHAALKTATMEGDMKVEPAASPGPRPPRDAGDAPFAKKKPFHKGPRGPGDKPNGKPRGDFKRPDFKPKRNKPPK